MQTWSALFSLTSCNFCFTYSGTAFCGIRKIAKEAHFVGSFGSNGPLDSISFYIGPSLREGERRETTDGSKNVQLTPIRTHRKRSRPLPHHYPNLQDAPALEVYPAPSHRPTTPKRGNNQDPSIMIIGNIFLISVIRIKQKAKRLSVRKKSNMKKYISQAVNAFCHV